MADSVRIGFIGAGGIAQHHILRLREIPQAQIVALCDLDQELARRIAAPFSATIYKDSQSLISQARLDALYICVPPFAHGDIEIQAAQRGLHMFVEKPVNLYPDQALKACEAIQKAGVMTQSGYSLRYLAGATQLKYFLADKSVGTAHVTRWSLLSNSAWWRNYKQSGGQLVEMTTHQVDLLRWVMGEIEAVSARYSFNRLLKDEPNITVPDSQNVLLHFKSGAVATINTSCAAGRGECGSVEFIIHNARVIWRAAGIKVEPDDLYVLPPPVPEIMNVDEAFVRAVLTGDATLLRSPYADAMKSVAVTLAANKSAENGGQVVKIGEMI